MLRTFAETGAWGEEQPAPRSSSSPPLLSLRAPSWLRWWQGRDTGTTQGAEGTRSMKLLQNGFLLTGWLVIFFSPILATTFRIPFLIALVYTSA